MENALIRRVRPLPPTAKVLVEEGQRVKPETPVAKLEVLPGRLWRLDVARELAEEPSLVPARMLKQPGQRVDKGEIVAAGGDFFERRAARSPATGTLALVSRNLGFAYVRDEIEVGSQGGPVTVDVAKQLDRPPWQIMALKSDVAMVGGIVLKGQLLASRKTDVWSKEVRVTSPIYGKITSVSPVNGNITIAPIFRSPFIPAYLSGEVSKVSPEGIEVSGRAQVINGIWGLGGESWGPLQVLDGDLTRQTPAQAGAVVVARGTATHDGLLSARDKGARGLVLGYLSSETIVKFCGGTKNMGITGDEDVPFPLILIQGFLPSPMNGQTFSALLAAEGHVASIRGVTHIRAGVIRPEIVISLPDAGEE